MSKRNHQRAARRIQSECGEQYTRALDFVKNHHEEIKSMVQDNEGRTDWRRYNEAAAGLWRRLHPEED